MIYAAAILTGLGGLLVELVLVRRHGLLLGNTAEAASLVLGVYLLGLGVGGLLVPSVARRGVRPVAAAAVAYAGVALSTLGLDAWVERLNPVSFWVGILLVVVHPGLPTVLMGLAFPLLFSALGGGNLRWSVGWLLAANLAGSLIATAWGGNIWIPELGLRATLWLGAGAYLLAAVLLGLQMRRDGAPPQPLRAPAASLPPLGFLALAAALAGGLVVGFELFLLRRLPFFLGGFQPTLSGVIGVCLLALTLGSAFGASLLARALGERALAASLLLGALTLNLGLQERLVLPLSSYAVRGELGLHLRIWLATAAVAGLPCFFLGATLPLCVARFLDPATRSAAAGRLFFWQGIGSVAGAMLVGQLLPRLWPQGFFVLTPPLLALLCAVALVRQAPPRILGGSVVLVLAASLLGVSGAGSLLAPAPPLAGFRFERPGSLRHLDHRTDSLVTASVAYDRRRHSMVLYTDEFRAAETGAGAGYMKVLGHLPFLLSRDLRRTAVIGLGTGSTARELTAWPDPDEIHLVEISPAVFSMIRHFAGDGPLSRPTSPDFLSDARVQVHLTDGRRYLGLLEPRSLDLITMEPLLPYAPATVPLYTREFYALANRALSEAGLLLQWVPTHAMPRYYFETLLATFAASFDHYSVWLVDTATLLVGSPAPHLPAPAALSTRMEQLPPAVALSLHESGLASALDLLAAYVGNEVGMLADGAEILHDDRPFLARIGTWKHSSSPGYYPENLGLLSEIARRSTGGPLAGAEWERPRTARLSGLQYLAAGRRGGDAAVDALREGVRRLGHARSAHPESVLLHREETLGLRRLTEAEILRNRGRGAARLARRQLRRDVGSALLQAALALEQEADANGAAAAARAVAIDPLFFAYAPGFLGHLAPEGPLLRSPLEEIEHLPNGEDLARAALRDDALGLALRAAYPLRCARAIIELLGHRPLRPAELEALGPMLDPQLLLQATRAVRRRGGSVADELASLAREDLPPLAPDRDGSASAADR